jgi:hypothetical protein
VADIIFSIITVFEKNPKLYQCDLNGHTVQYFSWWSKCLNDRNIIQNLEVKDSKAFLNIITAVEKNLFSKFLDLGISRKQQSILSVSRICDSNGSKYVL